MKFSAVTTTYNSGASIITFIERMSQVFRNLDCNYEIVIVDDGSKDDTLKKLKKLAESYECLRVFELSRNFGHHPAIMKGVSESNGDLVFLIDSDLEESPELLSEFLEVLRRENVDVVYGIDEGHERPFISKKLSQAFWKVFNYLSGLQVPLGLCTVRLMTRRYVNALIQHEEYNVFLAGLWQITGFSQMGMKIKKTYKGKSAYNFNRKMNLALTSMISFSGKPLRLLFSFGFICIAISIILISFQVARFFMGQISLTGWLSIISLNFFLWGVTITFLGLISLYVSAILEEVKIRPRVIVSNLFESQDK